MVLRVASLSPAITEIIFALDAQECLVCVDKFSDAPDEVKSIPHLPEHQKITKDMIREFQPEVVFTETLVQEKVAKELEGDAWKVIHLDPRSINDVYETIKTVGLLLDCTKEAEALLLSMRQGFNAVSTKAKLFPKRPRVYIEEWHNPPMVSGNWVGDIVRIAGGEPFPLPKGAASREVSLEEIASFNPEIIVLSICGAGRFAEARLLTDRPGWADLEAAKEGRIRVIDDSLLNRPGPRLTEGANRLYGWLFEYLH